MKYKRQIIKISTFLYLIVLIVGCQKNEDFQKNLTYTEIRVGWVYNPDATKEYTVIVDDKILTNSLSYQGSVTLANSLLTGDNPHKKLVVKNTETGETVLDLTIQIKGIKSIRLFQFVPEEPVTLYDGIDEAESDPPTRDDIKLRWYYSDNSLPDSIKLVFFVESMEMEDGKLIKRRGEKGVDSVILHKRELSAYKLFTGRGTYGTNSEWLFNIYDAKDGAVIQLMDENPPDWGWWGFSKGYSFMMTARYNKFVTGTIYDNKDNAALFGYPSCYQDKVIDALSVVW